MLIIPCNPPSDRWISGSLKEIFYRQHTLLQRAHNALSIWLSPWESICPVLMPTFSRSPHKVGKCVYHLWDPDSFTCGNGVADHHGSVWIRNVSWHKWTTAASWAANTSVWSGLRSVWGTTSGAMESTYYFLRVNKPAPGHWAASAPHQQEEGSSSQFLFL